MLSVYTVTHERRPELIAHMFSFTEDPFAVTVLVMGCILTITAIDLSLGFKRGEPTCAKK